MALGFKLIKQKEKPTRHRSKPVREPRVRINRFIRVPEIRLIDAAGEQLGVYVTTKAMELAQDQGLDLVEISPNAKPPVCKIMDYGKYKYLQTKKQKEAKKHQVVIVVKEIKFRPNTDQHDFEFKLKNIERFLEAGNKVKVTIRFRGREMAYKDRARDTLKKIAESVVELAQPEMEPKMEGRQLTMMLAPVKKGQK